MGGGGWGRFLREARVGCRWNNRWGRSFIVVSRLHTRQYHPIMWGQLQYPTAFLPLLLSSYFPFYLMVFSIVLQKFFLPCVKYSFIADINSWLRTCWVFNVKPPRVHRTFEQKKFLTEILMILKYQKTTPWPIFFSKKVGEGKVVICFTFYVQNKLVNCTYH